MVIVMATLFFTLTTFLSVVHFVIFLFLDRNLDGTFNVKMTLKDSGVFFLIVTVIAIVALIAFILLTLALSATTGVPHSLF